MKDMKHQNYDRIAKVIAFIKENYKEQPTLEELAQEVHLSPFHFQRIFTEWVGTSPKKFLQYITIQHAKRKLKEEKTLFDTAYETGLSGTSRLHELFVNIEGMSPKEYKDGGRSLWMNYSFSSSAFGEIFIASTEKGICHLSFIDTERENALDELKQHYPKAQLRPAVDAYQENALDIFSNGKHGPREIKLHLKGTDFQLKVWEALLKIPYASLATYSTIAKFIHKPAASRAVGNAIGNNPIAFIIPCHRVIKSSGELGGYKWNSVRKMAMIGWEEAKTQTIQ